MPLKLLDALQDSREWLLNRDVQVWSQVLEKFGSTGTMKTCSNVYRLVSIRWNHQNVIEVGSKEDLPTARQGMEYDLAWKMCKGF